MSSFFRSAVDDSTSMDEENTDVELEGILASDLRRVQTISSDNDADEEVRPSGNDPIVSGYTEMAPSLLSGNDAAGSQSFLLHALLEERCVDQALEHMNNRSGASHRYTKSDPEVRLRAQQLYQDLCRHLGPRGFVPQGLEQERFRSQRRRYQQGLGLLSRGLSDDNQEPYLPGSNRALALPSNLQGMFAAVPPSNASYDIPAWPLTGLEDFSRLSLTDMHRLPSPLDSIAAHRMLDNSRYHTDFMERGRIGKGGYGEVFCVEHKISGVQYAVKKIPIGASRVQRIHERGQAELDMLLTELRTLARLDHPNIVRYFNGWLEFTSSPLASDHDSASTGPRRLLLDRPHEFELSSPSSHELHIETRKGSVDIVFEHSNVGVEPLVRFEDSSAIVEADEAVRAPQSQSRSRRDTWSSTTSRKSNATKASVEDEDVIDLPRAPAPEVDTQPSFDASSAGGILSDTSDLRPIAQQASILTLHLQMSLHPLTLAEFITLTTTETTALALIGESQPKYGGLRHCFHTLISLLIVLSLLEGVEYLHSEGLVHRDLKPANIFLSPSSRMTAACVDSSCCPHCASATEGDSTPVYINFRIGDFGLVTAMAEPKLDDASGHTRKVIGTQHYRPPQYTEYGSGDARLDVFALGIILFELLWPFSTRMERHDTLEKLKAGVLPDGFITSVGKGGEEVASCVLDMLNGKTRLSCGDMKKRLLGIVKQIEGVT